MKHVRFLLAFAALFFASAAAAQYQVPNYNIPIGRGTGQGFKSAAPGTAGVPLISAGAAADPVFGLLGYVGGGTNANTQVGARNNIFPTATVAGSLAYWNGTAWAVVAGNTSGTQCFTQTAAGSPAWSACGGGGTVPGGSAGQVQFNSAGAFGGFTLSGDATLNTGTGALTLASTIAAAGPIGSATAAPVITFDAKGRLTTVTSATITPAVGSITGLGAGCATWLATPSSANLLACLTNETGTGSAVFSTSPALAGATQSGPAAAGVIRIPLTANTTFNVATTGTDSANCTGGSPCLTVQRCVDNIADYYDLRGFVATCQLANGTYAPAGGTSVLSTGKGFVGAVGPQSVVVLGSTTPGNVILSTTSADVIKLGSDTSGMTQVTVAGVRLQTTTAGHLFNVSGGGVALTIGMTGGYAVEYGATTQDHIVANHNAWVIAGTGNTIVGNALIHVAALSGATVALHGTAETCTGVTAFTYYAYAETNSNVFLSSMTFPSCGAVTGTRFFVSSSAVVYAVGAATLPGAGAGVEANFGRYIDTSGGTQSGFPLFSAGVMSYVASPLPVANGGTGATTGAVVTVKQQKFTASGTYTPSTGMLYAIIECFGGGGAGGGAATGATVANSGGGGGSGGYSRVTVTAAAIGASKAVTIGAGGTPGAAGANNGGNGGDTSVGTLCIGKGGTGGAFGQFAGGGGAGAGGVAGTGDDTFAGAPGMVGFGAPLTTANGFSGAGGGMWGGGAPAVPGAGTGTQSSGVAAAANSGAGGSGAVCGNGTVTAGGGGGSGYVRVTDFNSQ